MKRVIKKVLSIVLCFVMLFGIVPLNGFIGLEFPKLKMHFSEMNLPKFSALFTLQASAATSGTCGDNLTWNLDADGTLTISGSGKMNDYNNSNPPWSSDLIKSIVISDSVTSIGFGAFYNCTNLTNVMISNSVNKIGDSAFFGCSSLTNVIIPNSVRSIGYGAFAYCKSLIDITVPDSVTFVGERVFWYCENLQCVTMSNKVPKLTYGLFENCNSLTNITIPNGIKSIGEYVFKNCIKLNSIIIPKSILKVNQNAFYNCNNQLDIYYDGKNSDWELIDIDESNTILINAIEEVYYDDSMSCARLHLIKDFSITYYVDDVQYCVQNYDADQLVKQVTVKKEGYAFSGWKSNWNGGAIPEIMPAQNIEFYGSFTIKKHRIFFNTAGGNDIATIKQDYGTSIIKPENPIKKGYTFMGWDKEIPEIMPDEDIVITALWSKNSYELSFDNLDLIYEPFMVPYGSNMKDALDSYFTTWVLIDSSKYPKTPHNYENSKTYNYKFSETGAKKLKLKFSSSTYFENNFDYLYLYDKSGTLIGKYTGTSLAGRTIEIPDDSFSIKVYTNSSGNYYGFSFDSIYADKGLPLPTKEGYTLVRWNNLPEFMPDKNVTISPVWEMNTYTITYIFNNGSENIVESYAFNQDVTVPSNPQKEGYTFSGWTWSTESTSAPTKMPSRDITATAKWNLNTYTITYKSYNGSGFSTCNVDTFDFDSSIYEASSPYRSGYTFKGWLWPTEAGIKPETMLAYNMTVYALWAPDNACPEGHDIKIIDTEVPTCSENGYSGDIFCPICKKIFAYGYVLPAYGHDYASIITKSATCTEEGTKLNVCNKCGAYTEETIAPTGHSALSSEVTFQPTCTEKGIRTFTCHCGYIWTEEITENGHSFDNIRTIKKATCEETGILRYTCSACGFYQDEEIKTLEHTIVEVNTRIATCTEDGNTYGKYCSKCNKIYEQSELIPALGHNFENIIIKEPTCSERGEYIHRCDRCGMIESEDGKSVYQDFVIDSSRYPQTSHNYSNNMNKTYDFTYEGATRLVLKFSSNTYFESGYDYLYLYDSNGNLYGSYTGSSLSNRTITLEGDRFSIRVTTDGSVTKYGFSFDSITAVTFVNAKIYSVPAVGHVYEDITLREATCQVTGEYAKRCIRCGIYEASNIPIYEEKIADKWTYPESDHNYLANQTYSYSYVYPKAEYLKLKFSKECMFESNYDYLYLYDKTGKLIGTYSGTELQNKEVTIQGDTVNIKLTSDDTVNHYGFKLDSITVNADISIKKYTKAKTDHKYRDVVAKPANPTQEGQLTRICDYCGYSYVDVIPKTLYAVGEVISYGSYPQSKVIDEATIEALNNMSVTWKSYKYYSGNGSASNGLMIDSDFMLYADVSYNENKYRAVTFSTYRPNITGFISSDLGTYSNQDENGYYKNKVYWFRYEPIQWRILDPSSGLVVCETVIDAQPYNNYVSGSYGNNSYYANNYEQSSIRKWLNEDFYNTAFSNTQKENVLSTELINKSSATLRGDTKSSVYDCSSTTDKVFLLSYEDVLNNDYSFSRSTSDSNTRAVYKGTDYARCQGLDHNTYGNCSWYLRTPATLGNTVLSVLGDGSISTNGTVGITSRGIRPAVRLLNVSTSIDEPDSTNAYTVTYELSGKALTILTYTPGDPIVSLSTSPNSGVVFSGWNEPDEMPAENIVLRGEYLPLYTATFRADGKVVEEVQYTTASTAIIEPEIPQKEGYTAQWEDYEFIAGGITVNAIYTLDGDHTHEFVLSITKQPTCVDNGAKTYECNICDYEYTEPIIAVGHSFIEYVYNNDATTEKDGTETQICSVCSAKGKTRVKEGTKLPNEHTHSYTSTVTKQPTCTVDGISTFICSCRDTYEEVIPAIGHKDSNKDGYCDVCKTVVDARLINPCKNAKINVASAKIVDYKSIVTIKATATGVPSNYYLAIYVNGKQVAKGTNTEVVYEAGQITSDINYTVKVIDAKGNVQKDANGKDLAKDSKVTVNASFFKKLIAFFKGLFGMLPTVTIKP